MTFCLLLSIDPGNAPPSKVQAATEQAQQADDDEVDGDDEVQQARLNQDENSGEQRDDRGEADLHIHGGVLCATPGIPATAGNHRIPNPMGSVRWRTFATVVMAAAMATKIAAPVALMTIKVAARSPL